MDRNKYVEVGGGLDVGRMWFGKDNPLRKGDEIEGRYVEKKMNVGSRAANVYILEVDGERVGIWGSAVIDSRFENVAIGKMVGIQYLGKVKTKDGKSEYNGFWVGQGIDSVGDEAGNRKRPDSPSVTEEDDFPGIGDNPF